jgi:hypothetical protein
MGKMVTKSAFELMFGFQPIPHDIESKERSRLQRLKKKNERQKKSDLEQMEERPPEVENRSGGRFIENLLGDWTETIS